MRDTPHPATIKTSAPSLEGVIERPRLLNALIQLPAASKWLQAPSGTGKSTLAASYARSVGKPFAWYRLDERDNDPAFFFDEFARSISAQLALTEPLPKFNSDDHDRQQEFAHRFAAALSAQLVKPALLVIDDVHRVTSDEMQAALAALIGVAAHSGVLFVSESTAPTPFFDAIAARRLSLLNDADLSFNSEECKAMTAALRVADVHCEDIAALTGGHAGALVLACELLRGSDPKSALAAATVERIHLHLLTKLIDRMPVARRELMLQTAFVAQLTRTIAETLAGPIGASEVDALAESGLIRRIGAGSNEVFEAHGLVRAGVQSLVHQRLGKSQFASLIERTATSLVETGQPEAAFALLAEHGFFADALTVLRPLAETYAAQGRVDLLMQSLAKLPLQDVKADRWLCFWTGQAKLRVNEEQARIWFTDAYAAFETAADSKGMRLAAACNVTAFALEWADMQQLDDWIGRHTRAGGDLPVAAHERFEPSLLMGVICAALVRGRYPEQIAVDEVIGRVQQLLDAQVWLSDDQRVQAATILIKHGHAFQKLELSRTVIIATRSLLDARVGGSLHRGRWLVAAAETLHAMGDFDQATSFLDEACQLTVENASPRLAFEVGFASANHRMKSHDLVGAAAELDRLETIVIQAPATQRAEYSRMRARLFLLTGRLPEGLLCAEEAMRAAVPAGLNGASLRMFEIELIYALAANDRLSDAIALVSRQDYEPRALRDAMRCCLRFLAEGDVELLRTGLASAREVNFINLLDRARAPLTKICEVALAHQIESEFVLSVIRAKKLVPPPLAGPSWPWSVHIGTLGGFKLGVKGKRYRPTHKAQDKPLELLKLMVAGQALGRESVEKNWIAERLWPDADPENARKSLDMTIARLRRLLDCDDAIVAAEGRLQLSPEHVWTDIRPLLFATSQTQSQRDAGVARQRPSNQEMAHGVASVLDLYAGPFLADEDGPPWLLAAREAIAARVRQVLLAADAMLDGSADDVIIPALRRALSHDPTSEDLARALMRAHLRQGQHGETINVYRQLREMLSLILSVAPSVESDHIRDQAYAAESAKSAES